MKESIWGYWIIVLGIFIISVMMLLQNFTTTNEQDYYLIKEVTEASMTDAIDYSHYRKYGELRIIKEKFVESFLRRFSDTVNINKSYNIKFYDIYEAPPKVSVKVTTTTEQYHMFGDATSVGVTNKLDAILETTKVNNNYSDSVEQEDNSDNTSSGTSSAPNVTVETTATATFNVGSDSTSYSCKIEANTNSCTINEDDVKKLPTSSNGKIITGWSTTPGSSTATYTTDEALKIYSTNTNIKFYAVIASDTKETATDGTIKGCTVYSIGSQTIYSDANNSPSKSELLTATAGHGMKIVGANSSMLKVDYDGKTGWIDASKCFINLAEYIPSMSFDITNGYSSIYKSSGIDIPGITNHNLYSSFGISSSSIPVSYIFARDVLLPAEKKAMSMGYTIKIYDGYRPKSVSTTIATALNSLYGSNKTVYNGINKYTISENGNDVSGTGWYLAQTLSMHNLGLAVDCTLVEDGTDVIMPTAMHELSTAAAKTSANMTKYPNAKTLQTIFYNSGGRGLDSEWWHYQLGNTSTDLAVSITTACNGGCNFGLS